MIHSKARIIKYGSVFALIVCLWINLQLAQWVFVKIRKRTFAQIYEDMGFQTAQRLNASSNKTVQDVQPVQSIINKTVDLNITKFQTIRNVTVKHKVKQGVNTTATRTIAKLTVCDPSSNEIGRNIFFQLKRLSKPKLNTYFQKLQPGGHWSPTKCIPAQHVAIIVPYRDRIAHLEQFLNHMHPFLQHQQTSYAIFIIEQVSPEIFNKASIMNSGFLEINKLHPRKFNCFFFHDVDLLPENDKTPYACKTNSIAVHLANYINIRDYELPKTHRMTGGVVGVRPDSFKKINGYSNEYWGWGGEDYDLVKRLESNKIKFENCNVDKCSYWAQKHQRDKRNPVNKNQMKMYRTFSLKRSKHEGLNSVNYTVAGVETETRFTKIKISITLPMSKKVKFKS
ncbi:unnamed protein product [Owenia fusiformis]|uniref:Beta-1,4-galactosyltransferase n=1 Tax=Owenia fusiformis TaxID=6347 RepID=A0A8J1U202_OWEFU|nr:unnamed protein product [Owenia fusiformis]